MEERERERPKEKETAKKRTNMLRMKDITTKNNTGRTNKRMENKVNRATRFGHDQNKERKQTWF